MDNSNRIVVCVRDSSCGIGGIHCNCCNRPSRRSRAEGPNPAFAGYVRQRLADFVRRDICKDPP